MSLDTYPTAHVEAMQARLAALEADNQHLTQVIAAHRALADAHRELLARAETERSKAMAVVRQVSGALDRLAALEAEAKQAREDEEWGIANDADVMSGHGEWTAQYWVDPLTGWISATAPTIHAALRALRAQVEGGTR